MKIATAIDCCRVCHGKDIAPLLDLGEQKIANGFHDKSEEQTGAPLNLVRCTSCGLVQLAHSVNTDLMYKKYWYRSSINQTMRDHLRGSYDLVSRTTNLAHGDVVIDIGCNDGTLLGYYPSRVVKVGVDPSNIIPNNCIHVNDYFTYDNVKGVLAGRKAKVITSIAMFYDLNDPKSFVADIRRCLRDDGIWVLELSYLPRMISNTAYDSICHEHVTYYSISTFMLTLQDSGLQVVDASFNDINGGSFRMVVVPGASDKASNETIQEIVAAENQAGYGQSTVYESFVKAVARSKSDMMSFLDANNDKKIYGYGASTKGQIILQYCDIGKYLVAIAERNPAKYGLYTPGSDVRICPEDEMRAAKPDYLLMFPWYFFEEFKAREAATMDAGCSFLLPLPTFRAISQKAVHD